MFDPAEDFLYPFGQVLTYGIARMVRRWARMGRAEFRPLQSSATCGTTITARSRPDVLPRYHKICHPPR